MAAAHRDGSGSDWPTGSCDSLSWRLRVGTGLEVHGLRNGARVSWGSAGWDCGDVKYIPVGFLGLCRLGCIGIPVGYVGASRLGYVAYRAPEAATSQGSGRSPPAAVPFIALPMSSLSVGVDLTTNTSSPCLPLIGSLIGNRLHYDAEAAGSSFQRIKAWAARVFFLQWVFRYRPQVLVVYHCFIRIPDQGPMPRAYGLDCSSLCHPAAGEVGMKRTRST